MLSLFSILSLSWDYATISIDILGLHTILHALCYSVYFCNLSVSRTSFWSPPLFCRHLKDLSRLKVRVFETIQRHWQPVLQTGQIQTFGDSRPIEMRQLYTLPKWNRRFLNVRWVHDLFDDRNKAKIPPPP